ncbi:MAG: hypothetical protein HY926_05415 [Elusimicrobia bacterium]|nr:hypothetical protein [Elusimicrobiota bacterium]
MAVEAAAAGLLLSLYLVLAFRVAAAETLYLGGDTTRDAARAVEFLRTGRFSYEFSSAYESGHFSLLYIPFIKLFGNTILALQAAALGVGCTTVLVLYAWLRRTFGLLPALCVGSLYTTAPSLLSHLTVNAEMNIPLLLGTIMLLRTWQSRAVRRLSLAAAGVFACSAAYIIFPFAAYLWCAGRSPGKTQGLDRRETLLGTGLFLGGLSLLAWKFLVIGASYGHFGAAHWGGEFLRTNLQQWRHPAALLSSLWTQWSAALALHHRWGPWPGPVSWSWVVLAWSAAFIASLAAAESRRWAVGLGLGLLAAGLVQSPGSLGQRHMIAFLPLQWAFLASVLAQATRPALRRALVALVALIIVKQAMLSAAVSEARRPWADKVRQDTELAARLAGMRDGVEVRIAGGSDNSFFCLKYLSPGRGYSFTKGEGPSQSSGTIHLYAAPPRPTGGRVLATRLFFVDHTSYDVIYHHPSN